MTAQSVTGTGQGSAEGKTKGTIRQTLGPDKIIGSTVVIADAVELWTTAQLSFSWPKLEGSVNDYVLVATTETGSPVAAKLYMDSTSTQVRLTGGVGEKVHYVVIKKGFK